MNCFFIFSKRVLQQLGIVYRQFYQHANCDTMRQLYISNVRSHLEYAAPVWDPHFQYLIQQLEKVQKLSLKMCTKNWKADYEMLLTICNVSRLSSRRHQLKLSLLYRIIVNDNMVFPQAPLENRPATSMELQSFSTRSFKRLDSHTNAYCFSFFPHTIQLWNELAPAIQMSDSKNIFKKAIRELYS